SWSVPRQTCTYTECAGREQLPGRAGVPPVAATIDAWHNNMPINLAAPEHLHAYSEHCKRSLQTVVNGSLLSKRDQLLTQMARMKARMDEVRAVRTNIERETTAEYESVVDRLHSGESMKILALQADHDDLGRQVEAIQHLVEEVHRFAQSGEAPLDTLGHYRALHDACSRLSSKPFKETIDVSVDNFEEEAHTYSDLRKKYSSLHKLLAVKDQMIWSLLEERKTMQEEQEALATRHREELEALTRRYQQMLQNGAEASYTNTPAQPPVPASADPEVIPVA
ncbi:hypothetical protein CYMTET_45852, partial [Cymbomonas tetramitiformis]